MPKRERTYERHGMTNTPEYMAWRNMLERCLNPSWPHYERWGGRGITICNEWRISFLAFYQHIGDRPGSGYSLDRIDNDGNYEPGNVRWVKRVVQQQNTRRNVFMAHDGQTLCLNEWARRSGVESKVIAGRIRAGLSSADCLKQGRRPNGAKRKLTLDQVKQIRRHLAEGETPSSLSRAFGVCHGSITAIRDGRTWKNVPEPSAYGVARPVAEGVMA